MAPFFCMEEIYVDDIFFIKGTEEELLNHMNNQANHQVHTGVGEGWPAAFL